MWIALLFSAECARKRLIEAKIHFQTMGLNLELFTFSFTKGLSEGERFLRGVFAGYDGTLVRSIPPNQTLLVSDIKASAMAWWLQLRKDAEWQKARVNSVSLKGKGNVRKEPDSRE